MAEQNAITWGEQLLPGVEHTLAKYGVDPHAGIDAVVVGVALVAFAYVVGRPFRKGRMLEPKGKASYSFLGEVLVGGMLNMFNGIIRSGARPFFVLLGSFALFILANNLIGLIPGFHPPTSQYNVTVVMALMVFFTAHYTGIRQHKFGYVKKFLGPLVLIAPLIFPIEIISHLVRPLSLSVRLFGNITGDHQVVSVFSSLLAVGLPVPFMALGVLVSFLQAYVFVLLAAVYFQDALDHPH